MCFLNMITRCRKLNIWWSLCDLFTSFHWTDEQNRTNAFLELLSEQCGIWTWADTIITRAMLMCVENIYYIYLFYYAYYMGDDWDMTVSSKLLWLIFLVLPHALADEWVSKVQSRLAKLSAYVWMAIILFIIILELKVRGVLEFSHH